MVEMPALWVVCVDQERGYYMAYDNDGTRGFGHSEDAAIVNALRKLGLVVQAVEVEIK